MAAHHEFEGKTKEDAVRKACEALGVSEDDIEIEVVSYGSTGIFGLVGAKKAKVKVTLTEPLEPEVVEEERTETETETVDMEREADAVAEIARKTLFEVIEFIVDDATVSVAKDGGGIRLRIEASNPAILIGRHGRTLDALQYIVRKIVRKKTDTRVPISFDVEGYRDRRKESLTQLALRLGEKVKKSGKPATISPMNAYDRRIIHVALKDDTALKTQSRGGGLFRKLVIFPQKKQR
jgi:spoIIIJ-associated protein